MNVYLQKAVRADLTSLPNHPIALSVFGSVARGDARQDSEVDILVELSHPVGLSQFIELQQRLEALLGCRVDLGAPRALKPNQGTYFTAGDSFRLEQHIDN